MFLLLVLRRSVLDMTVQCVFIVVWLVASVGSAKKFAAETVTTVTDPLDQSVQDVLDRSEQALLQYNEWLTASPLPMDSSSESMSSTLSSMQRLAALEQTYDDLIHDINTKRVKELQATLNTFFAQLSNDMSSSQNKTTKLTLEQLERQFVSTLSSRVKGLMQEELGDSELLTTLASLSDRLAHAKMSHADCLLVESAAVQVHAALMHWARDGIGVVDRAAYIVHQYTSPTYSLLPDAMESTLGSVWWRRYIPQDWEAWLPEGWQSWKMFSLPDHIFHTFHRSGAATAPPEAVLEATVLPGHCWPVSMRNGSPPIVTIGLTEPISVSAITVDHVSKLLLDHPEKQLQSAPKRMKVYGYSPCASCHDLGFDVASKYLLAEIAYDIFGTESVQTFPVIIKSNRAHHSSDGAEAASCSAVEETCSGSTGTTMVTSAVSLEVVENWGNLDYTCLYRVRIHGEPTI